MFSPLSGLGSDEMHALNRLPRNLVSYLAEEAKANPSFVHEYLIPALNHRNPHARIVNDITREAVEYAEDLKSGRAALGDLGKGFFSKIKKFVHAPVKLLRKIHHKITPKFMQKFEKKIHKIEKKIWKKYGNILITIAGAVLAPFTGGASMVAASLILAAKGMYDKKQAAIAAKRAAKKESGQLQAEAAAQEQNVAADTDKFYADNQAWFLQYGITPEKWAKLTLNEKIELIKAGSEGRLPVTAQTVPTPPPDVVAADAAATSQAAASAGIPQSAVAPPGAPPDQGYSTSAGGAPPPQEAAAQEAAQAGGTFEAIVEGKSIGTFPNANEAYSAILAATKPGDRFEIIANGTTMGLAVRTEEGAVEVPPEAEAKMKTLTPEQSQAVVAEAEKSKGGGIPWLLILGGGAAAVLASR
jgi:hypothetical protein